MTDLELTQLCAKAVGHVCSDRKYSDSGVWVNWNTVAQVYDPLHDDAQAMALDEVILAAGMAFVMSSRHICVYPMDTGDEFYRLNADMTDAANRRRARVECVAKMQGERK